MAKYRFSVLAAMALLLSTTPACAGGYWEPVTIAEVRTDSDGLAYISVTPPAARTNVSGFTVAACSTNGQYQLVFSVTTPAGQAMLSTALSAKLARAPVRVVGSGTCLLHPAIEGTYSIALIP